MLQFSIIVPVYNRPDEVDELLDSLTRQTIKQFEVIIVEDGSSLPCESVVEKYSSVMNIHYYVKPNSGPDKHVIMGLKGVMVIIS